MIKKEYTNEQYDKINGRVLKAEGRIYTAGQTIILPKEHYTVLEEKE